MVDVTTHASQMSLQPPSQLALVILPIHIPWYAYMVKGTSQAPLMVTVIMHLSHMVQ